MAEIPEWAMKAGDEVFGFAAITVQLIPRLCNLEPDQRRAVVAEFAKLIIAEHDAAEKAT